MKRRLVNKLMLVTGAGVTITLALTVGLTGALTAERVRSEVKAHAADKAAGLATQVSVQLTESLAATTTMAATVSGLLATGSARRSDIVALTRATLEQYPSVYGAWMVDTLQRQSEKKLSGTEATNKAGIFTPYWTKSETGAVQHSTFEIKPASQWYAVPTSTGKSFVTEPYLTRGHVVTSVVTPIRLDGETVGVAGLDIKLEKLHQFINAYRPFEDGRVMLLSSAGKWIVPIDKDQAMKDYAEAGRDEVKAALADGRMRFLPGAADGMVRLIYPFTTPGMGTSWVLLIDVPGHVFSNPVTRAVVTTAAGGALLLLVMLTLIFVTTRSLIGRPLSRTLATIGALIDRDYTVAIPDTRRRDEIGSINTALEIFRDKARQAETLLTEQEVNRMAQVQRATTISRHSEAFDHQVVALTEGVLALIGEVEAATARLRSEAQETSARSTSVAASSEQTAASVATIASATEELVASLGEIRRQMGLSTGVAEKAVVQADQANTRVNALMSAVTRIGEVIKLINAIASQTNLLALNATIEAARAGEAGKGFAVVAAEVKELANQTSRATDEIAQQIESIQAETNEAAQSIRVISATIHELNGISQAIHSATDQQGQAMQEIAHNIQDVSHGTQDISASISVVSRSADHTSVVASEIGSTASTLSERSIRLRQEIMQFISNVRQVA